MGKGRKNIEKSVHPNRFSEREEHKRGLSKGMLLRETCWVLTDRIRMVGYR